MKNSLKYIGLSLLVLFVVGLFFILLNPFSWGMRRMPEPIQPELSTKEELLFSDLKNSFNIIDISRFFVNKEYSEKIDFESKYSYVIYFYFSDTASYNIVKPKSLYIARYIYNNVLVNPCNMNELEIYGKLKDERFNQEYYHIYQRDTTNGDSLMLHYQHDY